MQQSSPTCRNDFFSLALALRRRRRRRGHLFSISEVSSSPHMQSSPLLYSPRRLTPVPFPPVPLIPRHRIYTEDRRRSRACTYFGAWETIISASSSSILITREFSSSSSRQKERGRRRRKLCRNIPAGILHDSSSPRFTLFLPLERKVKKLR